ncbi:hypothetical protein DPEC_G00251300 [Dallia pectoralis]|uniref:Uncharacterized protein n=1 Tax=Dallia pectoralis TaxID=75939 RepID=A0ACC2FT38_DALPE|nr:hypothetical protein DPEC_G00251300 [Dallia pectoralis]
MTNLKKSGDMKRRPYLQCATSVCRRLFGPVDHDELSRELKVKLRGIAEQDRRRWNFNFQADTPVDGIYAWEAVSNDSIPAFYQEATIMRVETSDHKPDCTSEVVTEQVHGCCPNKTHASDWGKTAIPPNEVNQENCSNSPNTRTCTAKASSCIRRTRSKTTYSERDIYVPQITDYFPKRRKSTSEIKVSQHGSPLSIPLEQTPRKAKIIL